MNRKCKENTNCDNKFSFTHLVLSVFIIPTERLYEFNKYLIISLKETFPLFPVKLFLKKNNNGLFPENRKSFETTERKVDE